MSWKSLITAGLFCLLASPAFAAPTMSVVKGGTFANGNLDANGNWVWKVQITPDFALLPDTTGTPVAAEIGFTSSKAGTSAAMLNPSTNFDTPNPGKKIFGTEPNSASTSNPAANFDGPIVVNGAGTTISTSNGSVNFATAGAKDYMTITVPKPTISNLATTITASGAYSGNGRLAQITGGTAPNYTISTFDTIAGAFTRTVLGGDADMNTHVDDGDLNLVLTFFNQTGKFWYQGEFTGEGTVDDGDLNIVLTNFNQTGGTNLSVGGGGGGLSASNVPEPASIALFGLALLGGLGVIRRKR